MMGWIHTEIAMLLISGTQLVVLIGIGVWLVRVAERLSGLHGTITELGFSSVGIIGAVAVAVLAIIWNFFLPLNQLFALTMLLVGLAGLARGAILWKRDRRGAKAISTLDVVVALAIAVLAAPATNDNYLTHYDSGLYHIPTMMLDSDGPILIGAANIHMRFGYNSSLYPLAGAFFYPYLTVASSVLVNAPLTALFGGAMVGSFRWNAMRRRDLPALAVAAILLFHMLKFSSLVGSLGSAQTDWPAFLVASYVTLLCVQILVHLHDLPSDDYVPARIWVACLVAAFAVTVKLTQVLVPFLPGIAIAMLVSSKRMNAWTPSLVGLVLAGFVGAVWCARGVLLSGCLVYPVFATCMTSLPWTIAPNTAASDLAWMASFGKVPGGASPEHVPPFLDWLGPWSADLITNAFVVQAGFLLALAALGILMRCVFGARAATMFEELDRAQRIGVLGIGAVLLGGVAVWFLTAPLPRYGEASIYDLACMIAAFSVPLPRGQGFAVHHPFPRATERMRWTPHFVLAPLIAYLFFSDASILARRSLRATVWPGIPVVQVEEVLSPQGLRYYKPVRPNSQQCWAAPRPCTYVLDPAARETHTLIWTLIERVPTSRSAS